MNNLINRASIGAKKTNYIFKARWLQGVASANGSPTLQVNHRISPFRFAFALLFFLTLGISNAWGAKGDIVYKLNTGYTAIATATTYAYYGPATCSSAQSGSVVSSASWFVTVGSLQSSSLWLGTNNNQKSKMTLGNGSFTEASALATAINVNTTDTYYAALVCRTEFENVDSVLLTYSTPGGTAPSEAWILYSEDEGETWSVGKKVTTLSTTGTAFKLSSTISSARYAFVIHSTGYCQFKVPILTFYEGTTESAHTITVSSNNNSWGTVSGTTTITATPADCYQVVSGTGGYTLNSGTATITHTGTSNTLTVSASTDCNITVNFEKKTVNTYIDDIQDNDTQEDCGTHDTPTLTDETPATSGTCAQQHWHFVGWVPEAYKASPRGHITNGGTSVTADGTTYYAVWSKGSAGTSATVTFSPTSDGSTDRSSSISSYVASSSGISSYSGTKVYEGAYGLKLGTSSATGIITCSLSSSITTKTITIDAKKYSSDTGTLSCKVNSSTTFGSAQSPSSSGGVLTFTNASAVEVSSVSISTSTKRGYVKTITIGEAATYSDSIATCCTALGSINGSVSWTNPTEAVVSWDNIAHVSSWTVEYKTGAGSYSTTNVSASEAYTKSTTNDSRRCTITGLTCDTDYDIRITATPVSGYCDKAEVLEDQNSGKWDLDYTFSGVSLKDGDLDEGSGVLCGDLSVTFEPLSTAYVLPEDVTVTIGGDTKTIDEDYLWDSETGELLVDGSIIDGNVTVSCTATLVGCTADPSIGAVSLSGTFNLTTVGVTVGTSGTGASTCAWTDYGFVWGTSANPTVGGSGCTKVQVGTDGNATSWSGSLTKSSFETGTKYYYRAYGKNSKDDAAFAYSSSDGTFTPQKVTFNMNGHGSSIDAKIVNKGGSITAPDAPTETGWTFNGWKLSGSSYNFSSAVNSDITLVADWSQNNYTVTMAQSPSAGATLTGGTTTAHYGGTINISTDVPDGYVFTGWTSSPSVTFASASSTSTSFTMPASNVTITANFKCGVTWMVNGEEWTTGTNSGNTQVTSGSKVASLPTSPTKSDCDDSKVFMGWRATEISGTSSSDPGSIFTTAAGSPTITGNTTFYAVFADSIGGDILTLTFPDDNSEENGLTSNQYISTWTAKEGDYSFSIYGFNNNNWAGRWTYIRCGRKSTASTATITTSAAMSVAYDTVLVTIDAMTSSGVDTVKVYRSSSSDFSSPTIEGLVRGTGVKKVRFTSPAANQYYKIEFTCNNSYSSNGYVQVSKVQFKKKITYSNYVTTCAECTAAPTFNDEPAVTGIGCTGATVTATDGLATLGTGDGCNIREYGFVWGTSRTPTVASNTGKRTVSENIAEDTEWDYDITGLTKGTQYYVRAYAVNKSGTAYSDAVSFYTQDVSSIAITTTPAKTNYIVGETFDPTGMVVTATMADDSEEDVTSDVSYSESALTVGTNQNFAINYTLCETEKSVNQKINVYTLTVTEGTNDSYGTYSTSAAVITITPNSTKTFDLVTTNADILDNSDGTFTVQNPTGNVTVVINYRDAEQMKVYYKVAGVVVTGLTDDVYESSRATLPTASDLATAMTSQSMSVPYASFPNFWGWSESEFPAQTDEPTVLTEDPLIKTEKTYHAVFTNMSKVRIDENVITETSYPGSETSRTAGGLTDGFKSYTVIKGAGTHATHLQFKKVATTSYIYNVTALNYIKRIEVGASGTSDDVPVYACSESNTISGSALVDENISEYKYVYLFPDNTSYFKVLGDNSYTYYVDYIDIFYSADAIVEYMTYRTNEFTKAGNWNTAGNWSLSRIPTIAEPAIIKKAAVVDVVTAKARSVVIYNDGSTNTGSLEISAGKALTVAQTVEKTTDGLTTSATTENDIVFGSTLAAGTGALVMNGYTSGNNKATVNFAVKAKKDNDGWVNQYIGTPFNDQGAVLYNYYGTQLYAFHPAKDGGYDSGTGSDNDAWWSRLAESDGMDAFVGYNILCSKEETPVLWMQGTLNASSEQTINGTKLVYNGSTNTENLLANSWMAPIHIDQFQDADFSNVEKTIYIFNAGTPAQYASASDGAANATAPGQYIVLPIASAPWVSPTVTVIPAMQGFSVYATGANPSLTLNYNRLVYAPALTTVGVVPTRAPRRTRAGEDADAPEVISLHVTAGSGYAANAYILGREDFADSFDDGWDGRFMEGDEAAPQLYAPTENGNLVINCVPNIEGTVVCFKRGSVDSEYTFTFSYEGEESWYLNDQKEQESTLISALDSYTFHSSADDMPARFVVSRTPIYKTPTGVEGNSQKSKVESRKMLIDGVLYIIRNGLMYDVTGALCK